MTSQKRTIVIDAMGGDFAPEAPVKGALLALNKFEELSIILTGNKEKIEPLLEGETYDQKRLKIVHTTEVVENEEESPVNAIRSKKDSSMVVGLLMVKNKEADGFISAGNTGSVMAGATFLVGRIKGVLRPALSAAFPTGDHPTLVLDVGANMDCKPAYLVQFAQMGSIYYSKLYAYQNPQVNLLNIGAEPTKGNQAVKSYFEALSACKSIHFTGNIEARDVFDGKSQIVVTDGYAGNIMLKAVEGTASYIMNCLKEEIYKSTKAKIGALMMKPALKEMKQRLDPRRVGGTALLGINGAVLKAHGNSKADSYVSAVDQCLTYIDNQVIEEISRTLNEVQDDQ